MSQNPETSESQTTTYGENIENVKTGSKADDLEAFNPSPPTKRIDDKAASLEEDIQALKAESRRTYFVLTFVATVFFLLFVGSVGTTAVISIATIASLIFLIGVAKWLEFPWVVVNLERWHDLVLKYCERKISGKQPEETEPLDDDKK